MPKISKTRVAKAMVSQPEAAGFSGHKGCQPPLQRSDSCQTMLDGSEKGYQLPPGSQTTVRQSVRQKSNSAWSESCQTRCVIRPRVDGFQPLQDLLR